MNFPTQLPAPRLRPLGEAPPLRWGILGTGWIAEKFVGSVKAHTCQIIQAVGSRSQPSAKAFSMKWNLPCAYSSYEDLVSAPDIDVIYIATPHKLHCEHALLAIAAGKHVFVEKPIAPNLPQATAIAEAAGAKGVFLAEAIWSYFLPKFDVIQQILDNGVIGEIRSVNTEYGEYLPRDHRIFDAALAGGPLLDLGTYPVSLLTKLLGKPSEVVGFADFDPSGVHGQLAVVMKNSSGAIGTMATTLYGFTPTNAAIVGTAGSIRFSSEFNLPGPFEVWNLDGSKRLIYSEPSGAHFEGLCYEAEGVAWAIAQGQVEASCRPVLASLETMGTLDRIRQVVGISFADAGLLN